MQPESEAELLARARAISGRSLGDLAREIGWSVPPSLRRAKGWVGQLFEARLGAPGGSRPGPDFSAIGVELKTLPVDRRGVPRESTFLASLSPRELVTARWETSQLYAKLRRVLWLPVEAEPSLPIEVRRAGSPLLWSPNAEDERALRADWERFASWVAEGWLDAVTGHQGELLQIRPKAQNAAARRSTIDPDGADSPALPRGFYLRARFTARILERHFLLPGSPP